MGLIPMTEAAKAANELCQPRRADARPVAVHG
jgi:hypothetical protein